MNQQGLTMELSILRFFSNSLKKQILSLTDIGPEVEGNGADLKLQLSSSSKLFPVLVLKGRLVHLSAMIQTLR